MATYNSFKKIDSVALTNLTLLTEDITDNNITSSKIVNDAVTTNKIADGAVSSDKLANSLNFSTKTITYRPIVNADISNTASIAGGKLQSGAAVTNLGYTPVNRAGDAMTGRLGVNNLVRGSDADSGILFGSGTVNLRLNNSNSMEVNSSGHVTFPNKPAFAACGQAGWLYANSYGGVTEHELGSRQNWTVTHQTGGTNFVTSTGRFTAPVSGWYHFSTMWYLYNDNNSTSSYVHLFFRLNNTNNWNTGSRRPYTINMHGNRNNYDDGANYNAVMYLNSGQYCSLAIRWHSTNSRHHAGHQVFSGQLVG